MQFGKTYVRGRVTQYTMVSPWRLPHFTRPVMTNRRLSVRHTRNGELTLDIPPPAPTDIDALLNMTPAPEPSSTDQSDIAALSSELWYLYSIKVPTPDATEISSQVPPSSSHHHHVTNNSDDAERIARTTGENALEVLKKTASLQKAGKNTV